MTRNIYDRPDFFRAYGRLPRSVLGLAGAPEWPAVRRMLPELAGRRIVDLGCGFGWFARFAAEQGAASVLALDLSVNMLDQARATNAHPAIEYRSADLETLALPAGAFDLAYSSLAFHYVVAFEPLVATLFRALRPGGRLVFTIEHPIFMASSRPGWLETADGRRTWPVDHYAIEGERHTDWLAPGVVKQHRMLGTTLTTLIGAGFAIRHVEEWRPTEAQIAAMPTLAEELDRPMLLLVAAERPAGPAQVA